MSVWLPGVDRIPGNGSGTWAPDNEDAPKLVIHTTEGTTIGGATSAYTANNSWPHVTADPRRRRLVQHVPLDTPARALRNTAAPGETNREGRVIQLEVVATAKTVPDHPAKVSVVDLTDADLDWLGAHVVGPMCALARVPLTTSVTFYGDRAGFTLATVNARQRLSAAAWDTYRGVLGHQHVPENTHWDPGPLDVTRILAAAGGASTPAPPKGWLDMLSDDEQKELLSKVRSIFRHCVEGVPPKPGTPDEDLTWPQRERNSLARIEAAVTEDR